MPVTDRFYFHVQNAIVEAVDFVCAHLPGTLQDDCLGFVEQYGDAIIKLLAHELDPEVVCQEIKLCKPPNRTGIVFGCMFASMVVCFTNVVSLGNYAYGVTLSIMKNNVETMSRII